jgi:hypothetical protein
MCNLSLSKYPLAKKGTGGGGGLFARWPSVTIRTRINVQWNQPNMQWITLRSEVVTAEADTVKYYEKTRIDSSLTQWLAR